MPGVCACVCAYLTSVNQALKLPDPQFQPLKVTTSIPVRSSMGVPPPSPRCMGFAENSALIDLASKTLHIQMTNPLHACA